MVFLTWWHFTKGKQLSSSLGSVEAQTPFLLFFFLILYSSVYVCFLGMYVCVQNFACIRAHYFVHVEVQRWCQESSLIILHLICWGRVSLSNPKLANTAHLSGWLAPGMPLLAFSGWAHRWVVTMTRYLLGAWDSAPQTSCTIITLTLVLPPQPWMPEFLLPFLEPNN